MARRVKTGGGIGDQRNIYADLALLGQLDNDQEGQIAPEDLVGTSQEPMDYTDVMPPPPMGDVRQNPNPDEYLENLRKIAQLPLAMSDSDELRQDALENLQSFEPQPEQPGMGSKIMGAIKDYAKPFATKEHYLPKGQPQQPSPETTVDVDTGMIPRTSSGQMQDPLEFIRMRVEEDPSLLEQLPQETRDKLAASTPEREKAFVSPPSEDQAPKPTVPPGQPISQDMVENYPEQNPQAGSMEQAEKDPQILQDLQELAGSPIPDDVKARAKQWEDIYTKQKDMLNAEEAALKTQAESGQLSTFDKVALGIAIAMPILIALRYGGTAGIVAAGEGLKGFSGVVGQGMKQKAAEGVAKNERLRDIQKERLTLDEKDLDINKKIIDSIEDKAARQFLKNKKFRKYGEDIGISTGDAGKTLWLDANKFDTSDEGIKRAREVVKDADETIGVMRDSNKVVNDVLEILDQLPKNTGVWEAVKKNAQWFTSVGGNNPLGGEAPKINVVGADGKTRQVDAFSQLKQKINLLQDLYNKQILGGTRLTGNVVTHWGGILGDPSSVTDWLSQDLNSFKDTTRSLKDIMNSRETENLVGKGFLRAPLEEAFPSREDKIGESTDNRFDRMRQQKEELRKKVK